MSRVAIEILRTPYQPALAVGHSIETHRLLTDLSLRSHTGWTSFRPCILDTGAPISLLPHRFWRDARIEPVTRLRIGGLSRDPQCLIDVTLARVTFVVGDAENQIGPLDAEMLLADSDRVPALLGMRRALAEFTLHVDIRNSSATIALDE